MCVDARLIPVLDEKLPALLLALDSRAKALEAAGNPVVDEGPGEPPASETPPPKVITGLGIGGSIFAALGVGTLVGAGVELSRGIVVEESTGEQRMRTDHQTPGYALVGVGATALVAGVILLGVDLGVQAKKRKQRASASQTSVFPILQPASVGVGVSGKF
jgi:hypothetical protein